MPRYQGVQRRIGLTGGIATGKSSVGRHLEALGFPLLDADAFARDALRPGSGASQTVLDRFGTSIQKEPTSREAGKTPRIDRAALGRIVFDNPVERQWLEQLIHPIVGARFSEELQQLHEHAAVVLMIPLLFEARLTHLCSEIWVVACTPEQQRQRLQARDHISDADANARIQAQWPLTKKISLADQVIDNSGQPDQWKAKLQQITHTTGCKGV
jgi:dephospho-CoA kinase